MGKKKKSRDHQVSKGIHSSVDRSITKAVRRDRSPLEVLCNKSAAWKKMQNPWITIPNSNPHETAKRFVRVRANDLWGDPRGIYRMGGGDA